MSGPEPPRVQDSAPQEPPEQETVPEHHDPADKLLATPPSNKCKHLSRTGIQNLNHEKIIKDA